MKDSKDDCKSINITEHKKSGRSTLNIIRTWRTSSNDPVRVEYNPDYMWFDYQALFDQTKIWVLHHELKIKEFVKVLVQHTDFEKNDLVKKILFKNYIDNTLINDICSLIFLEMQKVLKILIKHLDGHAKDYNNDDYTVLF